MKSFFVFLLLAGCIAPALSSRAIDLKQSKLTQVVNDVQIISGADKSAKAAVLNAFFKVPDILRTGPNSRAELVAEDQTITRVGANTVFSFDPANRTIDLQKGSLLFHSPKGRGGGTVQTGSATASVLGTTIVVTTTPDGGFKILVLEGFAEVKFLNGLKQHLSAGQMTFILPGGGMSPIIVFRLDSNAKSSQLINGFDHPLPSNSKIGDEINRQTKLINKGLAQDTGLVVGDKASAAAVEALDPNAAQNYINHNAGAGQPYDPVLVGNSYRTIDGFLVAPHNAATPVSDALAAARALSTDLQINTATPDPKFTFLSTGPFDVTLPADPDCTALLSNPFSGVFARNLNISAKNIDLAPYGLIGSFDFLAAQDINIAGSLNINFVPKLSLTAGGAITIAAGSSLTAGVFSMTLASCDSMHFSNVNIQNTIGELTLSTLGDLTLSQGVVAAVSTTLPKPSSAVVTAVLLNAGRDMNVSGTKIIGNVFTAQAGGSINITGGAALSVPVVMLTAGNGILLDNVSMTGSRLHLTAANDVHVGSAAHSQDLSSFTDVNISGHTLVFENVVFGGTPTLKSDLGLLAANPNTAQTAQRGYVNFISGVTYNGTLITSANQSTYINPSSGPGITISPR